MGAIEDLFAQATTPNVTPADSTQQLLLIQSLMQQKKKSPSGGNNTNKSNGGNGGNNMQVDSHGKLIIKPRPVPRGYKPPLDRWKGVTLQPAVINSLQDMPGALGRKTARHAVSTYRSYAEQARIYNSGVRPAATPGSSYHQQGLAMDDPWLRTAAGHKALAWLLHHGWNSGASFGDPSHFTYRVTG